MNSALIGTEFALDLPVTLSPGAKREALLATGQEVERDQVFEIRDLQSFPRDVREEVVSLREKIRLSTDPLAYIIPGDELRITGYGRLRRGIKRWELVDRDGTEGESTEIDRFFFVGPAGHTHALLDELLAHVEDDAPVRAMLAGAPLVDQLRGDGALTLEDVLEAYEGALRFAAEIEELSRAGTTIHDPVFSSVQANDDLVVFLPSGDSTDPAVGFLRDADSETFIKVTEVASRLSSEFPPDEEEAAAGICRAAAQLRQMTATDSDVWEYAVEPNVKHVFRKAAEAERRAAGQLEYEAERAAWIKQRGSRRLKLAAERGYKHDGIYRDERLATELPGFVALRGKVKIGDDVNPTEEALEAESETLERVANEELANVTVRLVWVSAGRFDGSRDGEHLQVTGYLGRHNVYRPVFPSPDDDIPF